MRQAPEAAAAELAQLLSRYGCISVDNRPAIDAAALVLAAELDADTGAAVVSRVSAQMLPEDAAARLGDLADAARSYVVESERGPSEQLAAVARLFEACRRLVALPDDALPDDAPPDDAPPDDAPPDDAPPDVASP